MTRFLLLEDDLTFSLILSGFLKKEGFEVDVVHRVQEALQALEKQAYHLLLLDYRLPDGTGLELLETARKKGLAMPAIIMTSLRDVGTAVRAMRLGAFDYITKPVNPDELLMVVREALHKKEPAPAAAAEAGETLIEGLSEPSRQMQAFIALVAPTDMSVIIQGESGTGKEHVARSIHQLSLRAGAPFVAVDCGAISGELANSELFGHVKGAFTGAMFDKTGLFEAAQGGTVLLDEVGNLSYDIQVKLLRALQERVVQPLGSNKLIPINVRVIAATNDDLLISVQKGEFREDLYHRLNEFKIKVPALRDRGPDLEHFVAHFIRLANRELSRQVQEVSPEVAALFRRYPWPGNLRELKNVVKRVVLLSPGPLADLAALPEEMVAVTPPQATGPNLKASQEALEREMILKTLQEVQYNKSKAARLLNIDRKTLYLKLQKYNLPG